MPSATPFVIFCKTCYIITLFNDKSQYNIIQLDELFSAQQ